MVQDESTTSTWKPSSTTLLTNGSFWQGEGKPHADWALLEGGIIAAVGEPGAPLPPVRVETAVVDLGGKFVLPGLQDAHIHVYGLGEASFFVNLQVCVCTSVQACDHAHVERVRVRASGARTLV